MLNGDVSKTGRVINGDAFGDQIEANKTRVQKAGQLVANWRQEGLNVELVVVPEGEFAGGSIYPEAC